MALSVLPALPEGRLVGGRWRVVRCIQAGGMGAVYEAVHRETQARCALKVMLPDLVSSAEMRARFRQEAMVTATIESDHIVKVFDGGTDPETGAPYLAMELLRGEDLAARLAARGRLPADEVVVLLRQAALALERTHAAGVVHRDLKPGNLFVTTRDDGSPCVKVLDYGIAKLVASASRAETTRAVGTPLYMAPEQVKGEGTIAAPADLYALAQIAYTLLVGQAYWREERAEEKNVYPLLMAITEGTSEPASARAARAGVTLPEAFDAWFAHATALGPDDRFPGAREMIDALAAALDVTMPPARAPSASFPEARHDAPTRVVSAPPPGRPPTGGGVSRDTTQPGRRSRVITVAGAVLGLAALGTLAWSARKGTGPAPIPSASAGQAPSVATTATARETASAPAPATGTAVASAAPAVSAAPVASAAPAASAAKGASVGVVAPRARPSASASAAPARVQEPSDPSDVYSREKAR